MFLSLVCVCLKCLTSFRSGCVHCHFRAFLFLCFSLFFGFCFSSCCCSFCLLFYVAGFSWFPEFCFSLLLSFWQVFVTLVAYCLLVTFCSFLSCLQVVLTFFPSLLVFLFPRFSCFLVFPLAVILCEMYFILLVVAIVFLHCFVVLFPLCVLLVSLCFCVFCCLWGLRRQQEQQQQQQQQQQYDNHKTRRKQNAEHKVGFLEKNAVKIGVFVFWGMKK